MSIVHHDLENETNFILITQPFFASPFIRISKSLLLSGFYPPLKTILLPFAF